MALLRLVALLAVPWLSSSESGLESLESLGRGLAIEKELIQLDQWHGRNDGKR
jgi:hypothetical protein